MELVAVALAVPLAAVLVRAVEAAVSQPHRQPRRQGSGVILLGVHNLDSKIPVVVLAEALVGLLEQEEDRP